MGGQEGYGLAGDAGDHAEEEPGEGRERGADRAGAAPPEAEVDPAEQLVHAEVRRVVRKGVDRRQVQRTVQIAEPQLRHLHVAARGTGVGGGGAEGW